MDANVYIMPSAIENSPNSLCEAQILGVPVVASYCGGTPTLMTDQESGYFYRYEEYEMLAQIIIMLFGQSDFLQLSLAERMVAQKRHNRKENAICLKIFITPFLVKRYDIFLICGIIFGYIHI